MGSLASSPGVAKDGENKLSLISQSFGSSTSASASSTGPVQYTDIFARLEALSSDDVEFTEVQIIQQPIRTGVAEHHLLVYWYYLHPARPSSLKQGLHVDWGQNGLSFNDCTDTDSPQGSIVRSKDCCILPSTLLVQLRKIEKKVYNLVMWNCRHFCLHLFDRAGGNWKLTQYLEALQSVDGFVSSAGIHQRDKDSEDGDETWSTVYWCEEPDSKQVTVLQLAWSVLGLTFHKLETYNPHNIIRVRECHLSPADVVLQLREVEGWYYHAETWNEMQFAQRMFDCVPARGGYLQLLAHLDELTHRGVEISGVLDVLTSCNGERRSVRGDHHVLVYKYKVTEQLTMHLLLDFGPRGVFFSESQDEPAGTLLVRSKPMLFVRLQPRDLQRQLQDLEHKVFDEVDWTSQHFCTHLFSQAPGRERNVLRAIQETPKKKPPKPKKWTKDCPPKSPASLLKTLTTNSI